MPGLGVQESSLGLTGAPQGQRGPAGFHGDALPGTAACAQSRRTPAATVLACQQLLSTLCSLGNGPLAPSFREGTSEHSPAVHFPFSTPTPRSFLDPGNQESSLPPLPPGSPSCTLVSQACPLPMASLPQGDPHTFTPLLSKPPPPPGSTFLPSRLSTPRMRTG